jgi:hypothetical protein
VGVDPEVASDLVKRARMWRLDRAAGEFFEALEEEGIASLLLKGPATARFLYPGCARYYEDIDMLVHPHDFERATAIAGALGYTTNELLESRPIVQRWSEFQERTLVRHADGVSLDLHRTFHLVPWDCTLIDVLVDRAEEMRIGAAIVRVPDLSSVCLLALLHAKSAGHSAAPGSRLRTDVFRVLDVLTDETWPAVIALAKALGVERSIVAVLREVGGSRGSAIARRFLPQVVPARWLTAHLRTGSVVAFELCQSLAFRPRDRPAWIAMRIAPIWPRVASARRLRSNNRSMRLGRFSGQRPRSAERERRLDRRKR